MADLTIRQVENRLFECHNLLAGAQDYLRKCRDREVEAENQLTVARSEVMLSSECPKPKRGENGVTVAQRDAWVEGRIREQREALRAAEAVRKSAEDNLRVVRDQASVVQSLSALMRAEMQLSGSATPSAA